MEITKNNEFAVVAFEESPSCGKYVDNVGTTDTVADPAYLFSLFTADVIISNTEFVR